MQKLQDWFFANPLAWILLTLLIVAEWGNYHRGRELTRVCELIGPHDVYYPRPKTPHEEIAHICANREP